MNRSRISTVAILVSMIGSLTACENEAPPARSVDEFLDDPIVLEATMVRCAQDRSKTKYDAECVNAREAANRLAAVEEAARSKTLEEQSTRKRRALRRTQQAASEARRRAAELRRQREEAEYLGVFHEVPGAEGTLDPTEQTGQQELPITSDNPLPGNLPGVVVSQPEPSTNGDDVVETAAEPTDLESIREELKRRQEGENE